VKVDRSGRTNVIEDRRRVRLTREMRLAQVLDDFWGKGLADEKGDREIVKKIAEALGCDPARLNVEWSRVTGGQYGAEDSGEYGAEDGDYYGVDDSAGLDIDAVMIAEEEDENSDVGLEGVHTFRQE